VTTPLKKVAIGDVASNRRRGGDVRVLLSPLTVGSTTGFGGSLTLEPGEYISEHIHPYSEEFVYVIRGTVRMRVETEYLELGPGESMMVPIGLRHRVENNGSVEVQAVFHLAPLAPRPELGHIDTEVREDRAAEPSATVGGV
jgi:putative monooxygenase